MSFYALVSVVIACIRDDPRTWFALPALERAAGVFSTILCLAFYGLCLAEIVPALASGTSPVSLAEVGLSTNPFQVLDLGIVLPAFIVGGIALARSQRLAYWLVPVMLAFALLMDGALIGTDLSMAALGQVADTGPNIRGDGDRQPDDPGGMMRRVSEPGPAA